MNKVLLIGRVVRDAEVRYTQGAEAMAIARYTLAVDRRKKDENSADFISCVAFGKSPDFAEKYLHKGIKIAVEGRIQTGSYTNKDGKKIYTTDVVVESTEFAESKNSMQQAPAEPAADMDEGFMSIPDGVDDEGLPFN
jgi:single-strand DNA-binding protein